MPGKSPYPAELRRRAVRIVAEVRPDYPTGPDTPQARAASSLVNPSAIFLQNARSTSRRIGGRPGDRIAGRPVRVVIHPAGLPMQHLRIKVLRRPVESAQYTSFRFTTHLLAAGIDASIGTVGDALDNALMESQIGLYKTELIKPRGPGAAWPTWNWPPPNGSPGSTPPACTQPSATSRPRSSRRSTTLNTTPTKP
jgi:hypothetical protein